jgi:hypothetical protein
MNTNGREAAYGTLLSGCCEKALTLPLQHGEDHSVLTVTLFYRTHA